MSNNTELVITNKVEAQIDFNYEQAEQYLEGLIGDMKGWVIQEADLPFAKDTLADLNKLSKNVEDFRKKHKKEMEKPIREFEAKCKALVSKVDEVYKPLKLQYEGFEEKRKESKKQEVLNLISEMKQDSGLETEYTDKIEFKEKYLNKTENIKAIKEDLELQFIELFKQKADYDNKVETIKAICEMHNVKNNLSVELDFHNFLHLEVAEAKIKIEESAKRAAEREKEAIERIKKQEEEKANQKAAETISKVVEDVQRFAPVEDSKEEKEDIYYIKVKTTDNKIKALEAYMKEYEIKYFIKK